MYNRELTASILAQIEDALMRLKYRTADIHSANDFLLSPERVEKLDAVCMLFIAIGESLKSLDKVTNKELLPLYPEIPWKKVIGFRDVIAHHYFDIDAEEVWWVLDNELDPLIAAIDKMKLDI